MNFLLSSMSVVYVLTTPILEDGKYATMDQIRRRNKWDNDDYVCRGLILKDLRFSSGNIVSLFNVLHVPNIKKILVKWHNIVNDIVVPEEVLEEVVTQEPNLELRKGKRNRTPKNFGHEFQLYLIEGTRNEVSDQHSYCFNVEDDPKAFDEEMKSQDVTF
ncbi:hypothetical protein Tco_0938462 [Tanacetum coccineum]|uniref:Uncharacterized protein n=1 Tax=Tanacetum coccineum TaxID=301880 RepID=A0ABQ5DJS7_9ASTR